MTNKTPDEQESDQQEGGAPTQTRPHDKDITQIVAIMHTATVHYGDHSHSAAREEAKSSHLRRVMQAIAMRTPDSGVEGTPAVLYLDDATAYEEVREALEVALDAFDQKIIMASDIVVGSVWQAFVTALKRQTTPQRIDGAADILKAGAQARWHGEPQSQITKAQGEAIAALLTTLAPTPNALIAFSNMLIVKVNGVPLVRELTPDQVEHLQKNPGLYNDPQLALGVLDVGLASSRETDEGQQAVGS